MVLKGQAKTDYQKQYMRDRRAKKPKPEIVMAKVVAETVRPPLVIEDYPLDPPVIGLDPGVRPELDPVRPSVTPLDPDVTPVRPRIIKTVADAEAVASAVLEKHSPRAAVSAQFDKIALVSPSTGHRRRTKGAKMGFEPNRTDVLTAPEMDADNNPIPED